MTALGDNNTTVVQYQQTFHEAGPPGHSSTKSILSFLHPFITEPIPEVLQSKHNTFSLRTEAGTEDKNRTQINRFRACL